MDRPKGRLTIAIGAGGPPKGMGGMGHGPMMPGGPEGEEDDYGGEAKKAAMAAFLDSLGIDSAGVDLEAAASAFSDLMEVC